MNTKKRFFLAIIVIALVAAGCGRKEPPKSADAAAAGSKAGNNSAKEDGVGHKVLSFNLEGMTQKGEKKWEVIGRTARSISANEVALGNIIAKTYGTEDAVIVADEGIYDKSKNNVRLQKNVMATIENGGSAIKDQLGFSPFAPDASGDAAAKEAAKPKEKKKIIITCDGEVEFDYIKNMAYFNKNVKVKSADGDIDADRITVNLDPGTKKINDIVAEGHVKITQGSGNVAYGDKAKYNEADKKISLTGSPKIVIAQEGESVIKDNFSGR